MKKRLLLALPIFLVISSYTYVINLVNYGNPVYPLLGRSRIEVVSNNLPENLKRKTKIYNHFVSLFGYPLSDVSKDA